VIDCEYFSPTSDPALFACPCGGCETLPSDKLLLTLDAIRGAVGFPVAVISGPRCEAYNRAIGGAEFSEHIDGDGADIACLTSNKRYALVTAAIEMEVTRLGINENSLHIGVSESNDQDVIWDYY
jgi:uncharacterized protein YcbK (DUF882 family)